MGMSSHVTGFAPPDDKWKQMESVYNSCKEAGIEIPDEVEKFFDWEAPDESGVSVSIDNYVDEVQPYDGAAGYEIDLELLSKEMPHIKKIRFVNSW